MSQCYQQEIKCLQSTNETKTLNSYELGTKSNFKEFQITELLIFLFFVEKYLIEIGDLNIQHKYV